MRRVWSSVFYTVALVLLSFVSARADDRADCLCKAKLQEFALLEAAKSFGFIATVSGVDENSSGLKLTSEAEKLIPAECRKKFEKLLKKPVVKSKTKVDLKISEDSPLVTQAGQAVAGEPTSDQLRYPNRRKLTQEYTNGKGMVVTDIDIEQERSSRLLLAYRRIREDFQKQCPPIILHWPLMQGPLKLGGKLAGDEGGTHGPVSGELSRGEGDGDEPAPPPPYCEPSKSTDENLAVFYSLTPRELQRIIADQNFFGDDPIWASNDELKILGAYQKTLSFGCDEGQLKSYFHNEIPKQFSPDQIVALVQMKLARWNNGFDKDRSRAAMSGKGVVSISQLMCAERDNTVAGYYDTGEDRSTATFAGVCRDIMSGGAMLLDEAGFRNCVTVSYVKVASYHTTAMCRDPKTNKIFKLNWGDMIESVNVDGGQALFLGAGDATAQYTLSLPGGKTIAIVPSEMGKTLFDAAGFDIHDLDPMLESRGSALKVKDSELPFGFLLATDGNSAKYIGATYGKTYNVNTNHPLKVGVAMGVQTRPKTAYDISYEKNIEFVFGAIEQDYLTRPWKLSRGVGLRFRNNAIAHALFTRNEQDYDPEDRGDIKAWPQIYDTAGLVLELGDWKKDRVAGETFTGCQIVPGLNDVRDNYWAQPLIPVLNHCLFSAKGRLRLSESPDGRAYLWAATSILADYFGTRGRFDAGFESGKLKIKAGVEGRLKDDMPFYKEGTIRRAVGSIDYRLAPGFDLGLSGFGTLETDGDFDNSLGIMGNVSISK